MNKLEHLYVMDFPPACHVECPHLNYLHSGLTDSHPALHIFASLSFSSHVLGWLYIEKVPGKYLLVTYARLPIIKNLLCARHC